MATKKKTELTYAEGAAELEAILAEIESGDTDIDVLSEKVGRAADLIRLCRDKLDKTEGRVTKVVDGLAAEQEGETGK